MTAQEMALSLAGVKFSIRVIDECDVQKCDPILFLSGAFQDMDSWKRYVDYFSARTSIVLIDLPGTGKSDFLPYSYGLDFLSEALYTTVSFVGLKRINIVAASYGTPVAFTFARHHAELVSHLVLAGVMKEIPANVRTAIEHNLETLEAGKMALFADEIINGYTDDRGVYHNGLLYRGDSTRINKYHLVERVLRSGLVKMETPTQRKYIENTRRLLHHGPIVLTNTPDIPVLVFTGEHDVFTKPEYCRVIASAFRNGLFTTIKNADHLFHIEQFETSLELIDKFVTDECFDSLANCNAIERYRTL